MERICKSKVPSASKKKMATFMDLEEDDSASSATQLSPNLPEPASLPSQVPSTPGNSYTGCPPSSSPSTAFAALESGVASQPLRSKEAGRSKVKSSKKNVSDVNSDAPKKQKLQKDREELLLVERNYVEKVPSAKGLLGYLYKCCKCDRAFKIRLRCVAHARSCGELNTVKKRKKSQRKVFCNVCNYVATTSSELRVHRMREHSALIRKYRCTRCQKWFSSFWNYCRHVKRHVSGVSGVTFSCHVAGPGLPVFNTGS